MGIATLHLPAHNKVFQEGRGNLRAVSARQGPRPLKTTIGVPQWPDKTLGAICRAEDNVAFLHSGGWIDISVIRSNRAAIG